MNTQPTPEATPPNPQENTHDKTSNTPAESSIETPQEAKIDLCDTKHPPKQPNPDTPLGETEAQNMSAFFSALSDPNRLKILALLSQQEHCVCDIAEHLNISESATSHQLRTLRGARLIKYRRQGRQVFYTLDDHHVQEIYQTTRTHLNHTHYPPHTTQKNIKLEGSLNNR